MAWGDLLGNQMVSYTDATGGGFTIKPGKTNPGTPQCMTKAQAFDMYYLQTTSNTNTVASNQLMRKDYWTAATLLPYSYTLYYWSIADVSLYGFTTGSEACAETVKFITVYSSSSTITAGMGLFYDQYGNNPLYAASYTTVYPYYKLNSSLIRFAINDVETTQGYVVYDVSTCVAPSVTFSSWFYQSYTTGSQSTSGTVTIAGASATFNARAVVIASGTTCTANITINGTSRSAYRPTPGTTDSTTFTLSPGTYSYSVSITNSTGGLAVAGGIVWTQ